jgi:hypothetical protein
MAVEYNTFIEQITYIDYEKTKFMPRILFVHPPLEPVLDTYIEAT